MSINNISESTNDPCYEYFSYFNSKLFDSAILIPEETPKTKAELNSQPQDDLYNNINIEDKFIPLNLLDLSPIKDDLPKLDEKLIIKDIKPELHKYILPKSLFNSGKSIKNKENNEEMNSLIKHLDFLSQPFVPKNKKISQLLITDDKTLIFNDKENKKKKGKKRKNNFVKREGDWVCFKCKNLNFAFRNVCNKCNLPKQESEMKLFDIGKELMKLADLSIIDIKSNKAK